MKKTVVRTSCEREAFFERAGRRQVGHVTAITQGMTI